MNTVKTHQTPEFKLIAPEEANAKFFAASAPTTSFSLNSYKKDSGFYD